VSNVTTLPGQSFASSSLFTASDPGGGAFSMYAFWDTGTDGGHFVLNGVLEADNQEIDVTAAQLAQLSYQSGLCAHTLLVRVYDGNVWSDWSSFTVTGIDPGIIEAGTTLDLPSAYSGAVSFAAATGTLKIDDSSSFGGSISGQLAIGDVIDLADVTPGPSAAMRYTGNNSPGTLAVSDGTHTARIEMTGNHSLSSFIASSDGRGGMSVVDPFSGAKLSVIQTDTNPFGSTSRVEVGSNYFLYLAGASGPELSYSGAPVVAGEFGSWAPIGAVQTATGYDVAWKMAGADEYTVWVTDGSGNYISSLVRSSRFSSKI
jgi:hypothetical protein